MITKKMSVGVNNSWNVRMRVLLVLSETDGSAC